jgi:hypothetical protein
LSDVNPYQNLIAGNFSWSLRESADLSRIKGFHVYLMGDSAGSNRLLLGDVEANATTYTINGKPNSYLWTLDTMDLSLGQFSGKPWIGIVPYSYISEKMVVGGVSFRFVDLYLTFEDNDMDAHLVGGTLAWTNFDFSYKYGIPDNLVPYKVYTNNVGTLEGGGASTLYTGSGSTVSYLIPNGTVYKEFLIVEGIANSTYREEIAVPVLDLLFLDYANANVNINFTDVLTSAVTTGLSLAYG